MRRARRGWHDLGVVRRLILACLPALVVASALIGVSHFGSSATKRQNPIVEENQKPGSTGWRNASLGSDASTPEAPAPALATTPGAQSVSTGAHFEPSAISGYAGQTSVNHGGTIDLYVSTTLPSYDVEVYRMGWYGGSGGRLIQSFDDLPGNDQRVPLPDPASGIIDAGWQVSMTLRTGSDWVSGVYLVKLTASDGSVGYVTFVVRDDSAGADILYELPVATWQAYNNWGGKSLYDDNSIDGRAVKVSFNRPYAGSGAGGFFDGDFNMIRFLEEQGYAITYATSVDLQSNPQLLTNRKVFLSNFHDEYWSNDMRNNLTAALNRGTSLAFFDSNTMYWQVRFESSASGAPNRTLVCYKNGTLDPITPLSPGLATAGWRDLPVNRPENALLGVMSMGSWSDWNTSYPWVVLNASNWVYDGTGLKDGDQIPGVVGYEYDRVVDNGLSPAGLTTLSASPVQANGGPGTANGTIYQASSGAWVFAAGTNIWSWKLADTEFKHHGADPRIQRMTTNILDKMTGRPAPETDPATPPASNGLYIYYDSLDIGWYSSAWSGSYDLAATNPVYSGSRALSFTANQAYAGLQLQASSPFDLKKYGAISVVARASRPGQKLAIAARDGSGMNSPSVPLGNYGGDLSPTEWKRYTIPLADLGVADKTIAAITFQEWAGMPEPPVYLDEIALVVKTAQSLPVSPISPARVATPTPASAPGTVYDDHLAPGWVDESWSATVSFDTTTPVFAGSDAISFTANDAWAGLDLGIARSFQTNGYTHLSFALQASEPGQKFAVFVRHNGDALSKPVPIADYGDTPPVGQWRVYSIPLADLGATNTSITSLVIHEWAGKAQPALFVDQIRFVDQPAPIPAATPTASPDSAQATPVSRVVYSDGLTPGWVDESWSAAVDFSASPGHAADGAAIRFAPTGGWAGLDLATSSPVDAARYQMLTFALQASQPGERFAVFVRHAGRPLTAPLPLDSYGAPPVGGWKDYRIPLADLGASDTTITSVVIHEWSGQPQAPLFVDRIAFVGDTTAAPGAGAGPPSDFHLLHPNLSDRAPGAALRSRLEAPRPYTPGCWMVAGNRRRAERDGVLGISL